MLSLDAVTMISMERKLFQTVSTLLSRHFPLFVSKLNFWPFFPNLCLLMVNHLIPALLLLKETFLLDAVKIICMKRKLFHVVSTPFSWHYPSLAWITFFFPYLRVFMGNPLTLHLRFFIKMLSLDAVAMIERAILGCFHPISLLFSVIYLKNDFLASFPLFAHAHGQSLDPSSTFFDKNVITGCCCNDIF